MHLALNLHAELQHFELAVHEDGQHLEPPAHVGHGEQENFFGVIQIERIGDQVRQAARRLRIQHRDLQLFRDAGHRPGQLLERGHRRFLARLVFGILVFGRRLIADHIPGGRHAAGGFDRMAENAFEPADQNPHRAVRKIQLLDHPDQNADAAAPLLTVIEQLQRDLERQDAKLLVTRKLREDGEEPVALHRLPQGRQILLVDQERRQTVRKDHRVAHQEERRGLFGLDRPDAGDGNIRRFSHVLSYACD